MAVVRVQCYSGSKANERPIRFELDRREYMVDEVIEQWYGPEHAFFKVRADDDNIYFAIASAVTVPAPVRSGSEPVKSSVQECVGVTDFGCCRNNGVSCFA